MLFGRNYVNAIFITETGSLACSQIYPFYFYRNELKDRFGFRFKEIQVNDLEKKLKYAAKYMESGKIDLLFIQTRFNVDANNVLDLFKKISVLKRNTKLIYLDWFAPLHIPYPFILPFIDIYIKKQYLKNFDLYDQEFTGETNYTDYLAKERGMKFETHGIKVDPSYYNKLVLGWNFITEERLIKILKKQHYRFAQNKNRTIDVNCRVKVKGKEWYAYQRKIAIAEISKLSPAYNVVATSELEPQKNYVKELLNSKICVSPFGYGEICIRDFEAILCGCLLLKPSIEHLVTEPELFVPNETYVPIDWELKNLREKAEYYLENKAERERVVAKAGEEYIKYFKEKRFLDKIGALLNRLNIKKREA